MCEGKRERIEKLRKKQELLAKIRKAPLRNASSFSQENKKLSLRAIFCFLIACRCCTRLTTNEYWTYRRCVSPSGLGDNHIMSCKSAEFTSRNKSYREDPGELSRALSLRNLVSRYECGRAFPVGIGPGSLSTDAVNWLPSRFSPSVDTRRRYGWLRMVFPGARLFRAPIWCSSGGGGTREAGSTVVESLVALYRVGTRQVRRRRRAARSSTSQGSAQPLCARIKGANREVSEGKADV